MVKNNSSAMITNMTIDSQTNERTRVRGGRSGIAKYLLQGFLLVFSVFASNLFAQTQETLSGSITLPTGVSASGDVFLEISIIDQDTFNFLGESFVTINDGESQTAYTLNYTAPSPGVDVEVRFICNGNCDDADGGLSTVFYLQDDGSIDSRFNIIPGDSVPANLDFQFPEPPAIETLTGTLALPTGISANGDVLIEVAIIEQNNFNFLGFDFVTIADGAMQSAYSLDYQVPDPGVDVVLRFSCNSNCAEVDGDLLRFFYLQDDGTFSDAFNQISGSNIPAAQDFQFPEPPVIESIPVAIILPPSIVADGDVQAQIALYEVDSSGNFVRDLGLAFPTVPDSGSQVDFTFDYIQPDPGVPVQLGIVCTNNCTQVDGDRLTFFYLRSDGTFTEAFTSILSDDLPNSISFQFPEPPVIQSIPGTITLPSAVVANGDVQVQVGLFEVDSIGNFTRDLGFALPTVPDGASQVNFAFDYIQPEPGSLVRMEIACSSNCLEIDGDLFTFFFLQSDGTFTDSFTFIPSENLPGLINFQFPQAPIVETITGTINLPEGTVANGEVGVFVDLFDRATFEFIGSTFVTIPNGDSEALYTLSYPVPDPAVGVEFRISCSTNCDLVDGARSTDFFLQDDGSMATEFNSVLSSALPQNLNFQFPDPPPPPVFDSVQGIISLPSGSTADGDVGLFVTMTDQNTFQLLGEVFVNIANGATEANYALSYQVPDPAPQVQLRIFCANNCDAVDGGLSTNFIFQDDGTFSTDFDSQLITDVPDIIDFQFPEPPEIDSITGTILLAPMAVANGDVGVSINIYNNNTGQTLGFESVTIFGGTSSAGYALNYARPEDDSQVAFSISCFDNCGEIDLFTFSSFFLQDDGSFSRRFNSIAGSQLPDTTNFQFPLFETFMGTVSLPQGFVAPGEIEFSVFINQKNSDGEFFDPGGFAFGTIPSGDTVANFLFSAPQFDGNAELLIEYVCDAFNSPNGCGNLVTTQYKNGTGNVVFFRGVAESNPVLGSNISGALDLEFQEAQLLSGELRIAQAPAQDVSFSVQVQGFRDAQTTEIDFGDTFGAFQEVTLPAGQTSIEFDIPIPPTTMENGIIVSAFCSAGPDCGNIVQSNFFNSAETTPIFAGAERIPGDNIPESVIIDLLTGTVIDITASLPNPLTASFDLSVGSSLFSVGLDGKNFIASSTLFIGTGESASQQGIFVVPDIENVEYQIEFDCFDDSTFEFCTNFIARNFYSESGTRFDESDPDTLFSFDDLPGAANLELVIAGPVVNFLAVRPIGDANESNDISHSVRVTAQNQNGSIVGVQDLRTLPVFNNQGFIVPTALLPVDSGGTYTVSYQCVEELGSTCDPYIDSDPSYEVIFSENSVPDPVEIQLLLEPEPISQDSFEIDDSFATSSNISPGEIQSRTIHDAGDEDYVSFEILEGDTDITISTLSNNEVVTSVELDLFGANLQLIESADDILSDAEVSDSRLKEIALQSLPAGTYYLRVKHFSSGGADVIYSLRLELTRADEEFCFPIKLQNGGIALICL